MSVRGDLSYISINGGLNRSETDDPHIMRIDLIIVSQRRVDAATSGVGEEHFSAGPLGCPREGHHQRGASRYGGLFCQEVCLLRKPIDHALARRSLVVGG